VFFAAVGVAKQRANTNGRVCYRPAMFNVSDWPPTAVCCRWPVVFAKEAPPPLPLAVFEAAFGVVCEK